MRDAVSSMMLERGKHSTSLDALKYVHGFTLHCIPSKIAPGIIAFLMEYIGQMLLVGHTQAPVSGNATSHALVFLSFGNSIYFMR